MLKVCETSEAPFGVMILYKQSKGESYLKRREQRPQAVHPAERRGVHRLQRQLRHPLQRLPLRQTPHPTDPGLVDRLRLDQILEIGAAALAAGRRRRSEWSSSADLPWEERQGGLLLLG